MKDIWIKKRTDEKCGLPVRSKEDVGQALLFESKDKINWKFRSRVESEKPFGYMWECPDYFEVDGTKILSASVQGLEGGVWDDRNVYQS